MSSREGLLFASMLVTPSTLTFEQPTSEKVRFGVIAVVATITMLIGAVVSATSSTEPINHRGQMTSTLANG